MDKNTDIPNHLKDKERNELNEKQKKEKMIQLEKINQIGKIKFDLEKLKFLIMNGFLDEQLAKDLIEGNSIESDELNEVFIKLDSIEEIKGIEKILPKDLRITKEEYLSALSNDEYRKLVLNKIDDALTYLYQSINGDGSVLFNLFAGVLYFLNKNLQIVQENYIDLKNNLKSK
ncbi:MAG: hypothetical protein V3575_03745 [Candidatus Absconditabacteria bacterium]